jgi:hypothetical protein
MDVTTWLKKELFQKIGRELLLQDGSVEDMPPKAAIIKTNQADLWTSYHERPHLSAVGDL